MGDGVLREAGGRTLTVLARWKQSLFLRSQYRHRCVLHPSPQGECLKPHDGNFGLPNNIADRRLALSIRRLLLPNGDVLINGRLGRFWKSRRDIRGYRGPPIQKNDASPGPWPYPASIAHATPFELARSSMPRQCAGHFFCIARQPGNHPRRRLPDVCR